MKPERTRKVPHTTQLQAGGVRMRRCVLVACNVLIMMRGWVYPHFMWTKKEMHALITSCILASCSFALSSAHTTHATERASVSRGAEAA